MMIRYDELKVNDIVLFHGANLRITKITEIHNAPCNKYYPNEKWIGFDVEPENKEAEITLGKFYSHGSYGGVGCLEIELVKRNNRQTV